MQHEGTETHLGHVGDEVVEHAALTEEGVRACLAGVGLQVAIHSELFAGGAQHREQVDREGIKQQQSVAPIGAGNPEKEMGERRPSRRGW